MESGTGAQALNFAASEAKKKTLFAASFRDGESRTRTGDTTIFSRVLYQLS
jgi:hypothetical protein